MAHMTGGHIRFTERRKIGDYEHRDCEVLFNFSMEENDNHLGNFLDGLQSEVRARVRAMIKGIDPPKSESSWAHAVDNVGSEPEIELPKPRRGRKPKTPAPALVELSDEDDDGPVGDPQTIDDVIDEDDEDDEAKVISAEAVVAAVQKKNASLKDPPRIKALIHKYAPRSKEIPADKRAEFLAALEKIK